MSDDTTRSVSDDAAHERPGALVVLHGERTVTHALPARGELVLGRSEEASLAIEATSLSRQHATLRGGR